MYTQCPECRSVFSLDAQALAQAHGCVACGHCGAVFDSLATLCDQPPTTFDELPINEQALSPPRLVQAVHVPTPAEPDIEPVATPTAEAAVEATEEAEPVAVASSPSTTDDFSRLVFAPRFAKGVRPHKPPRAARPRRARVPGRRLWGTLCALLLLVLAMQATWIGRDALIRNPPTGAWLRSACATLGCRLPLVAAPAQLQLLASNVRSRPDIDGRALSISLSLRNRAAFAQPWPVVDITLFDTRHQRLAMRRLRPGEYLGDPAAQHRGLAAGATTALLLEVQDPGPRAVAYSFDFQ